MRTHFPGRQVMPELPMEELAGVGAEAAEVQPRLVRFLSGLDDIPQTMTNQQVADLGDSFTRTVLLTVENPPQTLRELVDAIENSSEVTVRNMFLVDEGAVPNRTNCRFARNPRLVFCWRAAPNKPPVILLSTVPVADDPTSLLQVISWSERDRAFHFFERKSGVWGWAGNSFHALSAPTRGLGPFDSHINGALVMKELKRPWSHWHTAANGIPREGVTDDDSFTADPLFAQLDGAETLEGIVRSGISNWTASRIDHHIVGDSLSHLDQYLRQVLWCTSVNLVSSGDAFDDERVTEFDLPTTFFYDSDAFEFLADELGFGADLLPPDRLTVDARMYRTAVEAAKVSVSDGEPSPHKVVGDTHFAFLVPERAEEDQAVLRRLVTTGVVSPRLGMCLLLVDFTNPVFSSQRASLLRHIPDSVGVGNGGAALDEAFIAEVSASTGSAETEFLNWWHAPDLLAAAAANLASFHSALRDRLKTHAGIEDILRLAASRRRVLTRTRTLLEFKATLPSGAARPRLALALDASLITKPTNLGEREL